MPRKVLISRISARTLASWARFLREERPCFQALRLPRGAPISGRLQR
jgi:hypothetical protein